MLSCEEFYIAAGMSLQYPLCVSGSAGEAVLTSACWNASCNLLAFLHVLDRTFSRASPFHRTFSGRAPPNLSLGAGW